MVVRGGGESQIFMGGGIFLPDEGNRRSDFDDSNLFQS